MRAQVGRMIVLPVTLGVLATGGLQAFAAQGGGTSPARGHHGGQFAFGMGVDYAKIIGVSETTFQADLKAGKSIVQIAASKKMSESTLIKKAEAAEKSALATQVKSKKITAANEATMLKQFDSQVKQMVERKGFGGPRGRGGPGQ